MRHSFLQSLLLLGLLCGLMTSCLEDIDLDTGERILNVYCILREGPVQELELSYIAPTGGTSRPAGKDVVIRLLDEGTPVGQFSRVSDTKWNLDFSPQMGHTYILEVNVAGENPLTAETRYPCACTLQYMEIMQGSVPSYDPSERMLYGIYGLELDSSEDQFLWSYYENVDFDSYKYRFQPDILQYFEDQETSPPSFAEYIVTDHPGVDGRGETIYPCDWTALINQTDFDKNRWGISARVFSKEFCGETAFYHEKVVRILHPSGFSRPFDNEKMRLRRRYLDEKGSSFTGDYDEEFEETSMFTLAGMSRTPMAADLVIRSVSVEYDKYLSDYYYGSQDTGDFTQYVYKRNFYSNVVNGTGIFGAAVEYRPHSSVLWPLLSLE